jgi:hypothetical protein
MEPQNLFLFLIKHVCSKTPVCFEHLPCDRAAYAVILLGEVPDMVAGGVHDDVPVRLLEAHEYVHHLELPLDDEGRVIEESHGGVCLFEDAMRVFRDVNGRKEAVLRGRYRGEGAGDGLVFRGLGGGWQGGVIGGGWLMARRL